MACSDRGKARDGTSRGPFDTAAARPLREGWGMACSDRGRPETGSRAGRQDGWGNGGMVGVEWGAAPDVAFCIAVEDQRATRATKPSTPQYKTDHPQHIPLRKNRKSTQKKGTPKRPNFPDS